MTDGATGAPSDLWSPFVDALPNAARDLSKSISNADALARCWAAGWGLEELIEYVTRGLERASSPAGLVAFRLASASGRRPPSAVGSSIAGAYLSCGARSSTRARSGRLTCARCL